MKNICLITQYFKVKSSIDIIEKQKEIDHVLKKNCENIFINKIYLLLEENYDINFVHKYKNKIIKIIIGKRLTYADAFKFYNKYLKNNICILANADIIFDSTISMTHDINWNLNLVLCQTRYEHSETQPQMLYGTNCNLAINSPWLEPFTETPFSQDAWIWCAPEIAVNNCNFNLGTTGCDNLISRRLYDAGYVIINVSRYINIIHYDHLSANPDNIKGQESNKRELRVGTFDEYLFLDYGIVFPDKYITNIENKQKFICDNHSLKSKILAVSPVSNIKKLSELLTFNCFYTSSSYLENHEPHNAILNSNNCWIPDISSNKTPHFITIKHLKLMIFKYIDIQGVPKELKSNYGHVTKFKIQISKDGITYQDYKINNDIKIFKINNPSNNIDKITRFYFPEDNYIHAASIKIIILEWHNIPALRFELYYDSCDDIDNYLQEDAFKLFTIECNFNEKKRKQLSIENHNNLILVKKYLKYSKNPNFDFVKIAKNLKNSKELKEFSNDIFNFMKYNNLDINDFYYKFIDYIYEPEINIEKNILNEPIKEGICVYTYVMNRKENIENYMDSWLIPDIDQLIILDWSSNENLYDIIKKYNDNRILFIRVNEESSFHRTYAQNLAARFCKFNKIMKIDSDVSLRKDFFKKNILEPDTYIVGNFKCARDENEKYTHGNIYLYLNDYFKINGYNEIIKTYGNDDTDFAFRLRILGRLKERIFDLDTIYHNPHPEEKRKINMKTVYNTNVEIFHHRYAMDRLPLWNKYFKLQEFEIKNNNNNYYVCVRNKNKNIYEFPEDLNKRARLYAIDLVISWYIKNPNQLAQMSLEDKINYLSNK